MFWGPEMKLLAALICGVVFGLGIVISGMSNPAKVLNFFDLAGSFDPSLLLVMVSALVTAFVGYRLVFSARKSPLFEDEFPGPPGKTIDAPLILGSMGFGLGWGITGFCPGGAVPALGLLDARAFIFMAALLVGMAATRAYRAGRSRAATA